MAPTNPMVWLCIFNVKVWKFSFFENQSSLVSSFGQDKIAFLAFILADKTRGWHDMVLLKELKDLKVLEKKYIYLLVTTNRPIACKGGENYYNRMCNNDLVREGGVHKHLAPTCFDTRTLKT